MKVNFLGKIIGFIITIPARLKGVKFGKDSFIGVGYDCLFNQMKNIVLGDNVLIGKNAWIQTIDNGIIKINDGVSIGRNVCVSSRKKISLGKNCLLSFNVSLLDHDHEFHNIDVAPINDGLTSGKEIIIDDDCFIGAHSFVLKGVHLGKHCVVGANSVVTRTFPPYSVIAGNPAKLIKKIKEND